MMKSFRLPLCTVLSLLLVAITAGATFLWYWRIPVMDDYVLLPFLKSAYDSTFSLRDILIVSGGHWHFLPLLLQVYLAKFTHWNKGFEVATSLVFLGWTWYYLIRILRRTAGHTSFRSFYSIALPLTTFVLWSLDQAGNFFWGWQIAVFILTLSVSATVFYLTETPLCITKLIAATLFCTLGIYSYLASFAMLPTGFMLIILHPALARHRKRIYAIWWTLYSLLMALHYHSASGPIAQEITLNSPLFYISFVMHFLGAGVARFAGDLASLVYH